jgi:membrane protein YdbS with pleckstrin-like domain
LKQERGIVKRTHGLDDSGLNVNLAKTHPIAFRYVWQRSFVWFIALAVISCMWLGLNFGAEQSQSDLLYWCKEALAGADILVLIVVVVKSIYGVLYRATYYYGIEGRHFVISKGVILKQRRSCPFNHITDFYIGRSFVDFLFQLNYLEVRTPAQDSEEVGKIEGLPFDCAVALQDYLTDLLERGGGHERESASGFRDGADFRDGPGSVDYSARPSSEDDYSHEYHSDPQQPLPRGNAAHFATTSSSRRRPSLGGPVFHHS